MFFFNPPPIFFVGEANFFLHNVTCMCNNLWPSATICVSFPKCYIHNVTWLYPQYSDVALLSNTDTGQILTLNFVIKVDVDLGEHRILTSNLDPC